VSAVISLQKFISSARSSRVATVVVAIVLGAGAMFSAVALGAPTAASASTVWSASGSAPVRTCPSTGCVVANRLGNNTGVTMVYWTDCQWAVGNYGSQRWFYIYYWGRWAGWIHSSYVYNQTAVPYWRAC
jgi:hypothetical protein